MWIKHSLAVVLLSAALAANLQAAPPIDYWTGGLGLEERADLLDQARDANLQLEFATPDGHYLADVRVAIRTPAGGELLNVVSDGPLFFARLPPGRYDLLISTATTRQTKSITLAAGRKSSMVLRFAE